MAFAAFQSGVLALEQVTGFFVIEGLRVPFDEREFDAIVFGVAASALLAGSLGNVVGGVQSLVGGEAGGNLGVTLQTLERRLAAKLVASRTVCRSVQGFMCTRKRSGRNLGRGHRSQPEQPSHDQASDEQSDSQPAIRDRERLGAVVWRARRRPNLLCCCLAAHPTPREFGSHSCRHVESFAV